jgi:hypothetical protein
MKTYNVIALLALFGLAACGGGGGSSGGKGEISVATQMVEALPGTYYAILRPVTFHSNGFFAYGQATFTLNGDVVQVNTAMDDDQAVTHRQTLHIGSRCPTMADDTNGDTYIDYNEAMSVVGRAIMPLDNDINSQAAGADVYPRGVGMTYTKTGSLARINADLGMKIGFEGRVVLIHGTKNPFGFPTSVAGNGIEDANLSMPVVCGILKKVD